MVCICKAHFNTNTCPPVSNDKEKRVISHDLWVKHQSPGEGNHSWQEEEEKDVSPTETDSGQ